MLQRALTALLALIVVVPFFLVGIWVTYAALLFSLGIGPHDKSTAFLILFCLLVPVGILGFGLLGYALLLGGLRVSGLEPWFERHSPRGTPSVVNAPFEWVRASVHRLLPRAGMKP